MLQAGRTGVLADAPDYWFHPSSRRVFLIANDERIAPELAETLAITPEDVLVQFNKLMHFSKFKRTECHKVLTFQRNGHGSHWGFSSDGRPDVEFLDQAANSLTLGFTVALDGAVVEFLSGLSQDIRVMCLSPPNIPMFSTPIGKVPSVGFTAASTFHYLNYVRTMQGKSMWKILLVGFTGVYSREKKFQGHAFAFEQANFAVWPEVTRLDFSGQPVEAEWGPLAIRKFPAQARQHAAPER